MFPKASLPAQMQRSCLRTSDHGVFSAAAPMLGFPVRLAASAATTQDGLHDSPKSGSLGMAVPSKFPKEYREPQLYMSITARHSCDPH